MQVPFRLRRLSEPRPVAALLALGHDSAALLALCARLRQDPLPTVFVVRDGFVLRITQPLREPVAGVIRLCEPAANVLAPVHAQLTPTLLPDEAAALGRRRGLVFLPEGGALEFHPDAPVALSSLLTAAGLQRRDWQAM